MKKVVEFKKILFGLILILFITPDDIINNIIRCDK